MKLIFITTFPISRLIGDKVDAWWFHRNGFDVEFLDISPLFFDKNRLNQFSESAEHYRYIGPNHRVLSKKNDVREILISLSENDFVWPLGGVYKSLDDDWLFQDLQAKNIRYYLQHFDTFIEPEKVFKQARYWIRTLKHRYFNRNMKPQGIVGSGRLGRIQAQRLFPESRFISVPSVIVLWDQAQPIIEGTYSLFVDENIIYAPDAKLLGYTVCHNPEAYYARLNHFFDKIEEWSGYPVVIAASGKYRYTQDYFNGRQLIYGQTLPLIQSAQIVLGHMSLALYQCLISNKPVLLLDDPDFSDIKRAGFYDSLMQFITPQLSITHINKNDYNQSKIVDVEKNIRIVKDYLREDGVVTEYRILMKQEFTQNR